MKQYTRREFLKVGSAIAAAVGLSNVYAEVFASGLEMIYRQKIRVLWLQGQSCSGCSVSLLNSERPSPFELITEIISLAMHQTLGAAQGDDIMKVIDKVRESGEFVLVVEGSIPEGMPAACRMAGREFTQIVTPLLQKASHILAAGTCATFGGIPAAEGAPTGALSVMEFMSKKGIPTANRLVNCPSCPSHPDTIMAILAHLVAEGYPKVDTLLLTPTMFFGRSTHDDCPRYHYYAKNVFAETPGGEGCLFRLGCLGPLTFTECPSRQWNGGVNWCIRAGAPCIGCTSPEFARRRDFPFYRKSEKVLATPYTDADRRGNPS